MKPLTICTLAALLLSAFFLQRADAEGNPLREAQAILDSIGSSPKENLKLAALPLVAAELAVAKAPAQTLSGDWDSDCGLFKFAQSGSLVHWCQGNQLEGSWSLNGNSVTLKVGRNTTISGSIDGSGRIIRAKMRNASSGVTKDMVIVKDE